MLRNIFILGLIFLAVTAFAISNLLYVPKPQRDFLERLSSSLASNQEVQVADVLPGAWDRVCVFMEWSITPDTRREELERWSEASWDAVPKLPDMSGHRAIPYPYTRLFIALINQEKVIDALPFKFTSAQLSSGQKLWIRTSDYKKHCFSRSVKLKTDSDSLVFSED